MTILHPTGHAAATPDKPACIIPATGEPLTYAALDARADQGAQLFRTLGLQRGDVVAVMLDNALEIFEIAWATQRAGLYLICIPTGSSASDLAHVLCDSDARLLIASRAHQAVATVALPASQARGFLVAGASGDFANWREARAAMPTGPIPDPSPGTDMHYAWDTGGRPTRVKPPLPDGAIDAPTPLTAMGQDHYAMGPDTRYLSTSSLDHAEQLAWGMTVHRLGGTVIVMAQFDAERAFGLIETHAITHATWGSTDFVRMLKLPDAVRARYRHDALRTVIHATAPCPLAVDQMTAGCILAF